MSNLTADGGKAASFLRSKRGAVALGALIIAVCAMFVAWGFSAQAANASEYRLVKAAILDCTASSEDDSAIDTSAALLEGLSFVEGNPFFLNPRITLESDLKLPLPTDKWIEKGEWFYDDAGRVKTATFYKSTNELSRVALSYDSHDSVSKVVGWSYLGADDGEGAVRRDFEASYVNEKLSSSAYGANKTTVVHAETSSNDTVLYTYDKDKNLTDIASTGAHEWRIQTTYSTSFKYATQMRLSEGGADGGVLLVPTYDGTSKLVSLKTGTWSGDDTSMSGDEYEIQYSKGKYSRVNYYQDDVQVRYYDFKYDDHGSLTSIRVYEKGGVQLYNITFSYQLA